MQATEFKNRMDEMIRQIKASEPAKGFTQVYLPGELEFREKEKRLKTGIPVDDIHWKGLQKLKQELGLKTVLK
jgi:LDH2 family malate/lactate/ureidoglycolate dehydrogenase